MTLLRVGKSRGKDYKLKKEQQKTKQKNIWILSVGSYYYCLVHFSTLCGGNGDRISRHNAVRDVLFTAAQSAALALTREATGVVANSQSRPADMFSFLPATMVDQQPWMCTSSPPSNSPKLPTLQVMHCRWEHNVSSRPTSPTAAQQESTSFPLWLKPWVV